MTQGKSSSRLGAFLRRLFKAERGAAAVEFAVIVPFMLILFLGGVEVSQAIAIQRNVSLTASTVANLVTQYSAISQTNTMPDILGASAWVLSPYSNSHATITVSLIGIDANGNATVKWSQAWVNGASGTGRTTNASITLPTALDTPLTFLILGEASYTWTPFIDYLHHGDYNLYSSVYMFPRSVSGTVTLSP